VLARLDDRDLKVELARWQAERDRWAQEYALALAKDDRAQVGITKSRIAEAQSQLDLVSDLLTRVQITSPIAGLVVAGDLDRLVGAPVQRGDILYEVAPLDDYRVMLDVAEGDVSLLAEGQGGRLILTGLTEVSLPLTISRITPVSHAAEGRNVFRVEASLDQGSDLLRPGMQGWAKVEVGQKRLLTLLTESAVAWLRLQAWRWLP
jgi:multidrug efflux pump subunit AcrA (membrane-fusion protein)